MDETKTVSNKNRILIVDDIEANRYVLRKIILEMGHQPILAENGVQALKILTKCDPQLILLDISMPEMDGYELCSILKGSVATREIPVIFISAFDDTVDIVKGFEVGGEDYITKPFIPEVVQARVGVHLKLSEVTRSLSEMNRRLKTSVNEQLKQMEQEKKTVLYALAQVARKNSYYSEDHLDRISYNCKMLSQAMQLSKDYEQLISDSFIEMIGLAAPLSDIGNVAVPRDILQKGSNLTEEERVIMQKHTTLGADMLQELYTTVDNNDFMQMSIEIAQNHHENWDGSGYPNGISGNEIPLSAQIVSLVSVFCALTEDRAYRNSFMQDKALGMMEADAGKKFNMQIFQICKKISRQLK